MPVTELVDEAARIGSRIVAAALRDGDECTWNVTTFDANRADQVTMRPARDGFYQGASGIALFLGELWHCTQDASFLACARRALRYCERIGAQALSPGLHAGNVGVALVAARIAELTHDDEWAQIAARRLDGLERAIDTDTVYDVIGGSAGAILGLLRMGATVPGSRAREFALRFGERLQRTACRTPLGWSWESRLGMVTQNLCGYAHGASGMAHAFLELFAATGDSQWRFAASRTMAYERHHEIMGSGDWPDFRRTDMIEAITTNSLPALRARILSGVPLPPRPPVHARAWCHGAPGIALTRIRAVTLGVDVGESRKELERALVVTRRSLAIGVQQNHSLCHGAFGNAETLLLAREHLGIDDAGLVASTVEHALSSFADSKQPWPSGVKGDGYEPSLLVGEAGIGHFLLRVALPDVASVVCVSDWCRSDGTARASDDLHRAEELARLLPLTHRAIHASPGLALLRERIRVLASPTTDLCDAVAKIRAMIRDEASPGGDLARDALAVDATVLDEQLDFTDFSEQFCHELARCDPTNADWCTVRVQLAPHARVIRTRWAWSEAVADASGMPCEDEDMFLIYRSGQRVERRALTPFQGLIVTAMVEPSTVDDVVAAVMTSVDADPSIAAELPAFIHETVREAVSAGMAEIRVSSR